MTSQVLFGSPLPPVDIWANRLIADGSLLAKQSGVYGVADFNDWAVSLPDPASRKNKSLPVHRWVPWVAGFSAHFASDCIDCFLRSSPRSQPVILDPFAGVGTTLVEAMRKGYTALGFEINPYAVLASQVKLRSFRYDPLHLKRAIQGYREYLRGNPTSGRLRPAGFRTRSAFFSPQVERQVCSFLDFAEGLSGEMAPLFRTALGAVMVRFSNYTYRPSLGSPKDEKTIKASVVAPALIQKLEEMLEDIALFKEERLSQAGTGLIHACDFLESQQLIGPDSVDLMVTSPPYLNNYHYIRNTRPQLYWLSMIDAPRDLKYLEEAHFGGYWQTVRSGKPVKMAFEHRELGRILERLRSTRRHTKTYGGTGWANYVASYFNDSRRFLKLLWRDLRRGGTGVMVIGNSVIQGHEVKTDRILLDLALREGFRGQAHRVRAKRVGDSIVRSSVRKGTRSRAALYESVLVLTKK